MSAVLERRGHAWETHPGWGITVDLTPREVLQSRQVRVHQRLIGLGLVLVLIICVGLALLVMAQRESAQRAYDRELATTARLNSEAAEYADITAMQTVVAQVEANLATVMAQDVDVVNLLAHVRESRPEGLTVTDQAVLIAPPVATPEAVPETSPDAAAGTTPGATDGTVPAAEPVVVGSVTISGNGPDISGINPFVSRLNRMRGVVDVVPTSVTQTDTGMTYTISMDITDELYTRRFVPTETP